MKFQFLQYLEYIGVCHDVRVIFTWDELANKSDGVHPCEQKVKSVETDSEL